MGRPGPTALAERASLMLPRKVDVSTAADLSSQRLPRAVGSTCQPITCLYPAKTSVNRLLASKRYVWHSLDEHREGGTDRSSWSLQRRIGMLCWPCRQRQPLSLRPWKPAQGQSAWSRPQANGPLKGQGERMQIVQFPLGRCRRAAVSHGQSRGDSRRHGVSAV